MINNAVEPVRIEPSIAAVIYLDQRGYPTPEEAVGFFEGDTVIRRCLTGSQSKTVLQGVEQCQTTLNATAYTCTNPNQASSRLDKAELRIMGGNSVHLALGNPKVRGDSDEALRTQPAIGPLRCL